MPAKKRAKDFKMLDVFVTCHIVEYDYDSLRDRTIIKSTGIRSRMGFTRRAVRCWIATTASTITQPRITETLGSHDHARKVSTIIELGPSNIHNFVD